LKSKKIWYYLPLVLVLFGIYGTLQPDKIQQKVFLILMLYSEIALTMQVAKIKKEREQREPWFDYFFSVLMCMTIGLMGLSWGAHPTDSFVLFFICGILIGKTCMLATYLPFRVFHLILHGLFLQITWEFAYGIKWIEISPLIRIFT
jgi:hypothetical protein